MAQPKGRTVVDDFGNTFVVDDSNTLISFEGNAEEITLPEEIEAVGKRVFSNRGFKKVTLSKNIRTFSNAAFIRAFKIDALYYPGTYGEFTRIVFEPGGGKKPILASVSKLFVLNEKGKYYQVVIDHSSTFEARGFTRELVDLYLSRDLTAIRATCKKTLKDNPDGIKSYVRYWDNQLKVIAETSFHGLPEDFREYLLEKNVCLLMDDVIIDHAIDKDTRVNRRRNDPYMHWTKSHCGDLVIEGDAVVGFALDSNEYREWEREFPHVAVPIGKEIAAIRPDAFKGIKAILINYDGTVKDWFNVKVEADLIALEPLVRCLDGTVEYVKISHKQRETRDLYYGYAHMGNQYRYSLQFAIRKANIWEFLKLSHKSIISWDYFCGTKYHCYDYDDNDAEYCILDYHNFKMISCVDVEAG